MGGTPSFAEFKLMQVSRNTLFYMLDHLIVKEFQVPTGIVHLTNSCGYGSPYSMHKVFIRIRRTGGGTTPQRVYKCDIHEKRLELSCHTIQVL